jgi:hypothetical protein
MAINLCGYSSKMAHSQLTRSSLRSTTLSFAGKKEGKQNIEVNPLYDLP